MSSSSVLTSRDFLLHPTVQAHKASSNTTRAVLIAGLLDVDLCLTRPVGRFAPYNSGKMLGQRRGGDCPPGFPFIAARRSWRNLNDRRRGKAQGAQMPESGSLEIAQTPVPHRTPLPRLRRPLAGEAASA